MEAAVKPIDRGEILGLAEYEAIRERFRARVIAEKKVRRVFLGPKVSVVFENRDTVLMQIQEMLRTERITRPSGVKHEIDTYNELIPGQDEVSCTLMVEIPDKAERDQFLVAAVGLESRVSLFAGSEKVPARPTARAGTTEDRTTALHFLKFTLPRKVAETLRSADGDAQLTLSIDHPVYSASAVLSGETVRSLAEDLRG
jgi:hypothetical protein